MLKLAAAAGNGSDALLSALAVFLEGAAPYDAAEVAVSRPLGFERWTLTDATEPLAAEDLLFHVIARREALRLDDWHESQAYPRTHERVRALGLRSLLVLPLNAAGGCEGAIVLGRRFGWAFVGASLRLLWPVAGITGLCLEKAIATQALLKEVEGLRRRVDDVELRADRPGRVPETPVAITEVAAPPLEPNETPVAAAEVAAPSLEHNESPVAAAEVVAPPLAESEAPLVSTEVAAPPLTHSETPAGIVSAAGGERRPAPAAFETSRRSRRNGQRRGPWS